MDTQLTLFFFPVPTVLPALVVALFAAPTHNMYLTVNETDDGLRAV